MKTNILFLMLTLFNLNQAIANTKLNFECQSNDKNAKYFSEKNKILLGIKMSSPNKVESIIWDDYRVPVKSNGVLTYQSGDTYFFDLVDFNLGSSNDNPILNITSATLKGSTGQVWITHSTHTDYGYEGDAFECSLKSYEQSF